jgi:hypothetical protein
MSSTTGSIPVVINANVNNVIDYTTICLGYSPIILSICILLISFFYQTYQGFLFFIFLIVFSFFRKAVLPFAVNSTLSTNVYSSGNNNKCSYFPIFQTSSTDGFNIFFITFVTGYFITPMILSHQINPYVITFFGVYFLLIAWNDAKNKCINFTTFFTNLIFGVLSVTGTMSIIVFAGLEQYLFLQDLVSDATICNMPSSQTFKCSVYKNGKIISSHIK